MSELRFRVYVDEVGGTFSDLNGVAKDRVRVTLSGGSATATAGDAVPVGELKWVEIDENGHLFVKRDGRYTAVGTDHGAPTHGIYLLSVDETGALLKDVNGQWLAATVVA